MTLRNPLDHDIAKTPGTAMRFVWGGAGNLKSAGPADDPPAPAAPRPRAVRQRNQTVMRKRHPRKTPPFVMEILSGAARSETKFDKPGDK